MEWARGEPPTLEQRIALLRRFRGEFDLGRDFVLGIFDRGEELVLGGTGMHTREGVDGIEIGYWIRQSHVGQGLATEVSAALTRVAFEVCKVDRVVIRVDPTNARSAAIPRRLGFVEEATLRRRLPPHEDGVPRDVVVFTLFRESYPASPSSSAQVEAYDALGTRLL
jgi:RimJ/RimL family protein N-acetyltransferase